MLLPSYLLVFWAVLSGFNAGFNAIDHMRILAVLGGIGLAEFASTIPPRTIEKSIAKYWVWLPITVACVELIFFALGMEQRSRELSEGFVGIDIQSELSLQG